MPKISEMYAFVVEDQGPDDEGVVAWQFGASMMPLVGADMKRIESLRPFARSVAYMLDKPVKLVHFINREELETIRGGL
jgi:hypothetical protein